MGIDITLWRVEKPGTSPRRWRRHRVATYIDSDASFTHACASSGLPMLSRADPYGSLVLSGEEMDPFTAEVASLDIDPTVCTEVLALARSCASLSDHELHLDGD
ncbi:hypothetical protein WBG06_25690 [Nocardioides sp. CCNWLW239]|uniref:hypothetical protein n=1 Tax=Nocardioides sp. CCNWLW239 TaxID=3128902 RepID=UPI0030166326